LPNATTSISSARGPVNMLHANDCNPEASPACRITGIEPPD
jgi:hypothetical protein